MPLQIYNTLTREKKDFEPLVPGEVSMYVCGVTVYDYSHVGHARAAIVFDVIYRYLKWVGFKVTYVRNFTDIDDKIINRSNEKGISCEELTEKYIKAFSEDMTSLGVSVPDEEPLATENIDGMIELIESIIEKGKAYEASGDVYFSVRSHEGYGKLSRRNVDDMVSGARVQPGEQKKDPLDFALWKAAKPGEPSWKSPWGEGRPGWHIECSVMSAKYLGQPFDIHGGGEDLTFPHHENEIAQSEAGHDEPLANVWIHNGMLRINAEKMSKSLGNFFTIREILERYSGESLRALYLSAHYRRPCEFSDAALEESTDRIDRLYRAIYEVNLRSSKYEATPPKEGVASGAEAKEAQETLETLDARFRETMDDDFNTARAMASLFEATRSLNKLTALKKWNRGVLFVAQALAAKVAELGGVLGLLQSEPREFLERVRDQRAGLRGVDPGWVAQKIDERNQFRQQKDYAGSDAVRDELASKGVLLEDSPEGTTWRLRAATEEVAP